MTGKDQKSKNSFFGKGVFPPKYAFTLLLPFRNIFLSPKKLIQRLDLKDEHTVLEIGPGPGYFSVNTAKTLKNGKLVLLDIQKEMLDFAKKRLKKRKIENVEYILCNGVNFDLDNESFDRVFMVTVMGEIENKRNYLREIHRVLKNDGLLSISELAGDPDKLSKEELKSLVSENGFEESIFYGSRFNYTMNFKKKQ